MVKITIIARTKITGIKVLLSNSLYDWLKAKERSRSAPCRTAFKPNVYWNGARVCTRVQSVGGQHVEINILYVIYLFLMLHFFIIITQLLFLRTFLLPVEFPAPRKQRSQRRPLLILPTS